MSGPLAVTCLTLAAAALVPPSRAQSASGAVSDCFASGSVVGAVLGTFFATAIATGLVAYALWWLYAKRHDGHNKGAGNAESGGGFDNPCFDSPNSDAADGGAEAQRGQDAKTTSWTPLRFFGPSSRTGKKRALDDSFVSEPEHVSVQLRGHDFTGLGFNVTGNMRDGIFVKDILNRGPAFESARIAQGDKIVGVTISFRHIVYEDALTILSYASPYDVTLELEKAQQRAASTLIKQRKAASAGSLATPTAGLSGVAVSGQMHERPVVHPLYRSQSIDDLSKVGRDASAIRADVRIPNLPGGLVKSKLLGKAHVQVEAPDVRIKGAKPGVTIDAGDISVAPPNVSAKGAKFTKFGIRVLPDLNVKAGVKGAEVGVTDLPIGLGAPDVELPKVQVHVPKPADIALTIDVPDSGPASVTLPKADVSIDVPEIKLPDIKQPTVEVSAPKIGVQVPDVGISVDAPDASLDIGKDVKSGFSFKFPKFGGGGKSVKLDAPEASVSVEAPSVDVSLPEASLEVDAKLKKDSARGGFKMPKLSMKKKGDASLDVKGAAAPSVSVEMPEVNVDVKAPKVELTTEVPSASVEAKKSKMGFSLPKFHMGAKGHGDLKEAGVELGVESIKVDLPEIDVPDVDVSVKAPSVHVKGPEVDVDLPSINVDGKKGKMGFSLPKFGMGGKSQADVDVPGAEIELAKVELESADHEKDGKKKSKFGFGLKMPKIGGGINLPDAELSIEAPKLDVNIPKVDVELAKVEMELTKVDVELPKVDVELPKVDVELPKAGVELLPKVDVALPKVEFNTPKLAVSAEASDDDEEKKKRGKFGIGFKMPKFGASAPGVDISLGTVPKVNVDLPSVQVPDVDASKEISIGLPQLDVTLPSVDVEAEHSDVDEDGKKKSSKFGFGIKMPKFGFSGPEIDVEASKDMNVVPPKVVDIGVKSEQSDDEDDGKKKAKFGFGVKMPKFGVSAPEVDVNLPKVDAGVKSEESDDESGKKKGKLGFGIKMPKFGLDAPDVDVGLAKVDVEMPSVEVGVESQESDNEDNGDKKKGKFGFGIKMPKFGASAPEIDVNLPKVDVAVPNVEVGLPNVDVDLPNVDVDLPSVDVSADLSDDEAGEGNKKKFGIGFKMPKFGFGSSEAQLDVDLPKVDANLPKIDVAMSSDDDEGAKKKAGFNIKMPKFGFDKPDIDVNVPDVKLEAPSVNVDVPEIKPVKVDVELPKASVEMPGMPSISAELPDVAIEAPKVEVDVQPPSVDVSVPAIELPSIDGKKSKIGFSLPKFHVGGKGDSKDGEFKLEAPEVKVDLAGVKGELPSVDANVNLPSAPEIELPSVSVEGKKTKMGFHLPSFHLGGKGHGEAKEVDLSVEAPSVEVKLPKINIDDDDGEAGKKKKSMKLPKFGLAGRADVDVSLPSVDVEMPKVEIDDADKFDSEIGAKKKKAGFHIKMPKFGSSKAELDVNLPDVELPDVKVPDAKLEIGGAEAELALAKADVSVPCVDIELPEVNVEFDPKLKKESLKGGSFDFKMPKLSMKKKGDAHVEVKGPSITTELPDVNVKLPEASVDVEAPSVDLPSVEGKKSKMGFSMPKFHLGGKGHGDKESGIDLSIDAPSVRVELPDVSVPSSVSVEVPDVEFKAPEVSADISAPSVNVEIPSVEGKKAKIGLHMPSLPKFGLGGKTDAKDVELRPKVELPDVNLDVPDIGVELTGPEVAVDVHPPHVSLPEMELPSVSVEGKKQKVGFHLPKFGLGAKSHGEAEIGVPEVEFPKVDIEAGEHEKGDAKKKSKFGIGFKMPKMSANVPEPELSAEAPKFDVNLPKVDVDLPKVDVELPKADISVKSNDSDDEDEAEGGAKKKKGGFHIKMPKFGGAPKAELGVNLPSVKFEAPSVDVPELKAPEASLEIAGPKVSLDEGPKKRYKFGFGTAKVQGNVADVPAIDVDIPRGKIEIGEVQLEAGANKPNIELELEHDDDEDKKKKSKFSIKMPKFHMKKKTPGVDVDLDASLAVGADAGLDNIADDELGTDDNHDKKRAKISVKMPKFGVKKPNVEVDLPEFEKEINLKASADVPSLEMSAPDVNINLPDVELPKSEIDVSIDASGLVPDVEIVKPNVNVDIEVPSVDVSAPSVSLELAKAELGIDADDADDDKKKGNKFSFKLPKFHLGGKHHGEVKVEPPGVHVELPEGESSVQPPSLELDANLGVDVHDDEADEKDGAKKKSRFGIKMPKFQMNKPHLSGGVEAGKIDEATVSVKLPSLTAEAQVEDMDVVLPKADIEITAPKVNVDTSIDAELPDAKKKGKFSFKKSNFKMPKIGMSGKGNVDFEAPEVRLSKLELDMPKVEAREVDLSLPAIAVDVETEPRDGHGEFTINIPKMDIEVPQVKPSVELSSASIEMPSVEPIKKSPFIDKMPELDPIAAGIDLSLGKTKIDLESDHSDDEDEAKSYKLGIKMPKFSFGAKGIEASNVDTEALGADVPGNVSVNMPAPSVSVETSELESEAGLKIGAKVPKLRQRVPDVVLPQVELKTAALKSDDEGKDMKIELKKPKFGIKLPTVEFNKPKVESDVSINLPRIDVQPSYAAESMSFELEMPHVELEAPSADVSAPSIDVQMENIDAEVAKTKAQLAQLQAELDIHGAKKENEPMSDDEDERKTKSSGFHLGLKMPKFHLGKEKHEAKVEVEAPSMSVRTNLEEISSPASLESEPVKLEGSVAVVEKEKKKFHLKMPKFQSRTNITSEASEDVDAEPRSFRANVKAPKVAKSRKAKKGEQPMSGEETDEERDEAAKTDEPPNLMDVQVKLPRVQVYKNVEYEDSERAHESSTDDEDESKDIKKNIGARFGVKLKKPKMFSSNKVEISSSKSEAPLAAPPPGTGSLQAEWKLPRVDLRRPSKSTSDQELSVDVADVDIDQHHRLEQLSPSERAEAIRRDAKASAGIRLHSPSYISKMHSPRSKKSSLEMMDTDSSPRLLSVTRLDSVPGPGFTPALVTVNAPQLQASQVPSTLLAASEAAKQKRGPPTPVKRSVTDPFRVAININASTEPVAEVARDIEPKGTVYLSGQPQASDTDISVTTSVDSDTLGAIPLSTGGAPEAPSRKASSLGDLTRIPPSSGDDGSLERTVSLDFKPVSNLGGSSRAIYNLAVQDLSRVGEDTDDDDDDYNLNRKRSSTDAEVSLVTVAGDSGNRTIVNIDAESLWFGSTSVQTVESAQTDVLPAMEESMSADVTLTTTSLGTSPSETSSGSEGCPTSPASPEPSGAEEPPGDDGANQVENGRQFTAEIVDPSITSNRTITIEMTSQGEEQQPQPLTDLNPSAGNFAAVRNRFEQMSGVNGSEALESPASRTRTTSQASTAVKRSSGTFDESAVIQKTIMQMAPEVSEGALSRTVIISSLHLERSETDTANLSSSPALGPESPVPNLEPPC